MISISPDYLKATWISSKPHPDELWEVLKRFQQIRDEKGLPKLRCRLYNVPSSAGRWEQTLEIIA
jgi:hypothetical protein